MSDKEISINSLSKWVQHVIKKEPNNTCIWFKNTSVFCHCIDYHTNITITDCALKRKLNKLSQLNRYFFKKDTYNVTEDRYGTYYLFISDSVTIDRDSLKEDCTQHSDQMCNYKSVMYSHNNSTSNISSTEQSDMLINSCFKPKKYVTKWDLPEALKYFLPSLFNKIKKEKETMVSNQKDMILSHLRAQMTLFRDGWLRVDAWKKLIADEDTDELYSQKAIHKLRYRYKYLFHTLDILIQKYHNTSITACAELAISRIEEFETSSQVDDINNTITPKTVMKWFKTYNVLGKFPNAHRPNGKVILPPSLENNPDIKDAVLRFCNENLSILTGELLHDYIREKCLPALLQTQKTETDNQCMTMSDLYKENQLKMFHPRTVNNWMLLLGFKYSPQKKTITMINMRVSGMFHIATTSSNAILNMNCYHTNGFNFQSQNITDL